jgi:hypothetical protein
MHAGQGLQVRKVALILTSLMRLIRFLRMCIEKLTFKNFLKEKESKKSVIFSSKKVTHFVSQNEHLFFDQK